MNKSLIRPALVIFSVIWSSVKTISDPWFKWTALCRVACHLWILLVYRQFLVRNPNAVTQWIIDIQFSLGFCYTSFIMCGEHNNRYRFLKESGNERTKASRHVNRSASYLSSLRVGLSPCRNHGKQSSGRERLGFRGFCTVPNVMPGFAYFFRFYDKT